MEKKRKENKPQMNYLTIGGSDEDIENTNLGFS